MKTNSKNKKNQKRKKYKSLVAKCGKTFCSKFFFKLTSSIIDPQLMCLQILQYEKPNRKKEEIELTIPMLITLKEFNDYYCSNETSKEAITNNLYKFSWILFYSFYKKNHIIKKPNEKNEFFYLILNGSIDKYSLIFNKNDITVEEYLKLLLKLKQLEEFEILNKMKILNNNNINVNIDNLENFCIKYPQYNYEKLKSKVIKELEIDGFSFNEKNNQFLTKMDNINNYLNLLNKLKNSKYNLNINNEKRVTLLLPQYEKVVTLTKGMFIGDLSLDLNKDNYLYICKENCDIGFIDKKDEYIKTDVPKILYENQANTLKMFKNKYYILQDINDNIFYNNYSKLFIRKTFKYGDKIMLQNSMEDGVFFMIKGEILVSTKTHLDRVTKLIMNIGESVNSFNEYISAKNQNKQEEITENYIDKDLAILQKNRNFQNEYDKLYKGEKEIKIEKYKEWDIFGLNEMYNKNTELSNFTAECISDYCILYFISKKNFNLIMSKEKSLFDRVVQLVELRSEYFIGVIKAFKSGFIKNIIQKIKSENSSIKAVRKFPIINIRNKTIFPDGRVNKFPNKVKSNLFNTDKENNEGNLSPIKTNNKNYIMLTESIETNKSNLLLNNSLCPSIRSIKNEAMSENSRSNKSYYYNNPLKNSLTSLQHKSNCYSLINANYNLFRKNKILDPIKTNNLRKDILFSFVKSTKNNSSLFATNNLNILNIIKKPSNKSIGIEDQKLPSLYLK